jgi:hypothetical protein
MKKPQFQEAQPSDWISIDEWVLSQYQAKLQKRPEFAPTTPLALWPDTHAPTPASIRRPNSGAPPNGHRQEAPPPVWVW